MEFRPVLPPEISAIWPEVAPMLARCKARGEWTTDDIAGWLVEGKMSLLAVVDEGRIIAGMIYSILEYPGTRVFYVTHLAGEGGFRWGGALLRWIDKMAAANNCSRVKFEGRPEWRRVLAPAGYQPVAIYYEKAITP